MTRDYRKRFEKIFHDCNSVSELLLKFDVSHINYPEETWPKMKYLFKILKTFRHSKDLDNDFIAWTYAHAHEVVNAEMASQWLSNMVHKVSNTKVNRSKFNTNLNNNTDALVDKRDWNQACSNFKEASQEQRIVRWKLLQ